MTSTPGTDASTATERAKEVTSAASDAAAQVGNEAKSQAQDVAETARDKAHEVAGTAKSRTEDLVGEAKDTVQHVAGDLREEARRKADEQGRRAAEALHDTSRQLQSMAQSSDQQGVVVDVVQDIASRVDRFASQVETRGLDGILSDVRSFARRQPGTFLFAAGAAGFLVGRLARTASSATSQPSGSTGLSQPGQYSPEPARTAPVPQQPALLTESSYVSAPVPGTLPEGRS